MNITVRVRQDVRFSGHTFNGEIETGLKCLERLRT